jgi:hypothetical protein
MQAMFDLHHDIMFFLISITFLVLYMLVQVSIGTCPSKIEDSDV